MGRRLFVGAFPPSDVRAALEEALPPGWDRVRGLRPVPACQWHVTLCFLGETRDERLKPLGDFLLETGRAVPCFRSELEGIGAFPRLECPKVLYIRATDPEGEWGKAAGRIREGLSALGFAPDGKPFVPHLTLARVGDPSAGVLAAANWRERLRGFRVPWRVGEWRLVESRLSPSGASYENLETYPCGA